MKILGESSITDAGASNDSIKSIQQKLSLGDGVGYTMISGATLNSYMTSAVELYEELQSGEYDTDLRFKKAAVDNLRYNIAEAKRYASQLIEKAKLLSEGCSDAQRFLDDLDQQISRSNMEL